MHQPKHPTRCLKMTLIQWKVQEKNQDFPLQKLQKRCEAIPKDSLVLLPEMWLGGFETSERLSYFKKCQFYENELLKLAQAQKIDFLGSALEKNKENYYNTIKHYSQDGKIKNLYRKVNLFKPLGEHLKFNVGNKQSFFNWQGEKIGLGICFDLRFPEFWRAYIKKGARILFVPAAWPKERLDHYLSLLKARAIENQCYVIGVNRLGKTDKGINYSGHSCIYGPWGESLVQMKSNEGTVNYEIDLQKVEEVRNKIPILF